MIDRRQPFLLALEKFLLDANSDLTQPIIFEEPPSLDSGVDYDVAIPCFALSKIRRKPPAQIAQTLAEQLKKSPLALERVDVVKGYVNIRFPSEELSKHLSENPLGFSVGALKGEKYVVDFSSPNIAKPFGIGHLRSTNIGAALCRILSSLGAEVVRVNHLGDWGTQFGKMITAYKRYGSADFVKGDPIQNLYKLYVTFHEKEEADPGLLDEAREWFVKLENGDPEAMELWKWFKDLSYHEFKRIYDRLGVEFDYVTGESFYNTLMEKTVERLSEKGLLKESEGALIVDLSEEDLPPCLIKKSDGSTLYATRDLATAEYRWKTFHPTKLVYVVGAEQTLHFRQVFQVLKKLGYEWAKSCVHVAFGLIKFPEGRMSTRKGNIILLDDVLKQSEMEALKIIQAKEAEKPEEKRLTEDEKLDVARKVGTGAVIFFDLRARRLKDVIFDWQDILSFDGDTGPYLQYTYVRMGSLLDRAAAAGVEVDEAATVALTTDEERRLARRVLNFPAAVEAAAREYEPSVISHDLLNLAAAFNQFYMKVNVMKGDEALRAGRLKLVKRAREALSFGLSLLGIQCPERM